MALCSVVEVALHFESFRNIDLFHQGLYHLKARLCWDTPEGPCIAAKPSGQLSGTNISLEADVGTRQTERTDHHHLIPAHIIDEQCSYSTRSFLIRYCEEEVELNEIGQFRLEVPLKRSDNSAIANGTNGSSLARTDASNGNNNGSSNNGAAQSSSSSSSSIHDLILEIDLMFADLTRHGGADSFGENPDVDSTEFKCVSTSRFRIRHLDKGIHEFCPVVFDEYHFCLTNVMLHSVLLDHRFRLAHLDSMLGGSSAASGSNNDGATSAVADDGTDSRGTESGAIRRLSATGARPSTTSRSGDGDLPGVLGPGAMSMVESLFGGVDIAESRESMLTHAEGFYRVHLEPLIASHEQLSKWFKDLIETIGTAHLEAVLGSGHLPELPDMVQRVSKSLAEDGELSTKSIATSRLLRTHLEARLGAVITARAVATQLTLDVTAASCCVLELWHLVLAMLLQAPREAALALREKWERRVAKRWSSSVVKEGVRQDLMHCGTSDAAATHPALAEAKRKDALAADEEAEAAFFVQDLSMMPPLRLRPLIFEERYAPLGGSVGTPAAVSKLSSSASKHTKKESASPRQATAGTRIEEDDCSPSAPKSYHGVHLVVLVHGFQGNSFDMRLMRNNLALLYPDSMFLSSTCNEDNTEGDINDMGIRLAQEVVNYICDWCPGSALGRLSFVAHSLGGLIVRAALPLLQEYSSKMFTFLSFSTSHLGIFGDRLSLFNTGFWMLKKWRNSMFLQQVSMSDHEVPRETFLYKLSKARGFDLFQNVVLTSCCDDQYGPMQSARAEIHPDWDGVPDKEVYREMVKHLWANVRPERVRRMDVNFVILEKNLDAFIGRTAHIQFLECQPMMKMLVHNWSALFR